MTEKNLMVELETLSTKHNAIVLQCSMALFDKETGKISKTFSVNIDPSSQVPRIYDKNTLDWWKSQPESLLKQVYKGGKPFKEAVKEIHSFITSNTDKKTVRVWTCSLSFTIPILRSCFETLGLEQPWKYWNERDCRTLFQEFDIHPDMESKVISPVKVIKQIKCLAKIYGD